jgi:hypothetical protein
MLVIHLKSIYLQYYNQLLVYGMKSQEKVLLLKKLNMKIVKKTFKVTVSPD